MIKIVLLSFSLLFPSIAFACLSSKEDIFNSWDTNKDGVVTLDEFDSTEKYGYPTKLEDIQKEHERIKKWFDEKIDANHDGKIDKSEMDNLPSKNRSKCGG